MDFPFQLEKERTVIKVGFWTSFSFLLLKFFLIFLITEKTFKKLNSFFLIHYIFLASKAEVANYSSVR